MKVTKKIDYCCLAYRSVQHLFIPCDTIIRSFKLAARYRMQAQNSVCSKVCAGYQFDCFLIKYKYTESKVETFNHVNIRCNVFDVHLSSNYLFNIT